jgi:predicted regulator of Ras-like GTPase activity (Roadblock/LC7/MglB family)
MASVRSASPDSGNALGRGDRLDRALDDLLTQAPQMQAAAVVSFDGLPMASALPSGMDEDRVAAMSAALLSLGERAAAGLGRGELSQVYVEGDNGTVFLVSADDEAVLVAVAAKGAKVGLMLFEAKQAAAAVAEALRAQDSEDEAAPVPDADLIGLDQAPSAPSTAVLIPRSETPAPAETADASSGSSPAQTPAGFDDVAEGLDAVAAQDWGRPGQGWS